MKRGFFHEDRGDTFFCANDRQTFQEICARLSAPKLVRENAGQFLLSQEMSSTAASAGMFQFSSESSGGVPPPP